LNPHTDSIEFHMPKGQGAAWEVLLDSAQPSRTEKPVIAAGGVYQLIARSTALLRELTD
jgi:hypothetical protein